MLSLAAVAVTLLLVASPSTALSTEPTSTSLFDPPSSPFDSSSPASRTSSYHFDERSGILTEFGTFSTVSKRDSFTSTFGMMLERDSSFEPRANKFQKRRHGDVAKRARDSTREVVEIELSKRGDLVLPRSVLERRAKDKSSQKRNKNKKKHQSKKSKKVRKTPKMNQVQKNKSRGNLQSSPSNGIQRSLIKLASSIPKISATITWYTGVDLNLPYCADKSGWTPTDNSLIAAVTLEWGKGRPACGSFLQLKSPTNNKSVIVRTVDMCGGCAPGIAHVDLSKAAFTALYALEVGKISDIQVSTLAGPPFDKWTPQIKKLYGPQVL
ncbi:hypothetical protein JCM10212_002445 [Sporobolomyces blumeae]